MLDYDVFKKGQFQVKSNFKVRLLEPSFTQNICSRDQLSESEWSSEKRIKCYGFQLLASTLHQTNPSLPRIISKKISNIKEER